MNFKKKKLKFEALIVAGQSPISDSYNTEKIGVPFLQGSADFGIIHPIERYYSSAPKKISNPGDILVSVRAPVGDLNISNKRYAIGRGLSIVRGTESRTKFLYYVLQAEKNNINSFSTGSTFKAISSEDLKNYKILSPEPFYQDLIVNFLDRKTSEIDTLIADKEKLIELLKEKRQAIITETVTKGLDQDVKMKDSGVEWIGEIPVHWELSSLNLYLKESKTKNIGNKEKNVLSLSYGRIKRRNVESNFGLLPESFETYRVVQEGDIVLRLTDLQNDKKSLRVGLVKENGIITSAYLTLVPNENILSEYASLLLHVYDLKKVFYGFGSGVRQSIGFQELKKLPVLLPNREEQLAICDYLKNFTENIDETLVGLKEQIDKLKEYRQSLIYEAVTGKIDVQEMVKETEQEEVSSS